MSKPGSRLRLRLIAGPNGSGKTTLTKTLIKQGIPLGQYLNPDDIARHICLSDNIASIERSFPKFSHFSMTREQEDYLSALIAQQVAVGLRNDWVENSLSLTYESVMSHESHLDFVKAACSGRYEAYLYYICTADPFINLERIQQRVQQGGHSVPEEKVRRRYEKSLELLVRMSRLCRRVYFFDNSGEDYRHIAEMTPDGFLDIFDKELEQSNSGWFIENVVKKWDREKVRLANI